MPELSRFLGIMSVTFFFSSPLRPWRLCERNYRICVKTAY